MRLAALLLGTFLFVTPALAQSADNTSNPEAGKAPPKAHRVWDNESIQQIQGGINVVGDSPTNNPGKPPDPKAPVRPKIPGVFFKGTTIDGDVVSSEWFYGKTVLVQYWATWCPQCRADQEPVDRIARSGQVAVLAVDVGESESTVRKYLKESPRACAILLEKDAGLDKLRTDKGFPSYLVIDAQGQIVARGTGRKGEEGLLKLLSRPA